MTFTVEDKLKAVMREIAMRKAVYPKWVDQKKMSEAAAEREIAVMEEIAEDYRRQQDMQTALWPEEDRR